MCAVLKIQIKLRSNKNRYAATDRFTVIGKHIQNTSREFYFTPKMCYVLFEASRSIIVSGHYLGDSVVNHA